MKEYVFTVKGMMCGHCEARVNAAVEKLGFGEVKSDHKKNQTIVCAETLDEEAVKQAIRSAGYTVEDDVEVREKAEKKGIFGLFRKK